MRYVVVGGGILGLAVADRLMQTQPQARITLLEKEGRWAAHQTGRNSGVIHSGLYYPPGSLKARLCRAGAGEMLAFAREHDIPHAVSGKLVVATEEAELPRLAALVERGLAHGLAVRRLDGRQAREIEPEVAAIAALHVPETGIIDYAAVCRVLASRLLRGGADLQLGVTVRGTQPGVGATTLETSAGQVTADRVILCAGLQSDLLAARLGVPTTARIVPFRGEYYALRPEASGLVRGLIYPVPDPAFPFLGVHLTRGIDGSVHAGPNAVLALAREGYSWCSVVPSELAGTLGSAGFRRLARRHLGTGWQEMRRSLSKRRFADSLRRLVPAIQDSDLVPAPAGVRAQAIHPDGTLVDDFLIERAGQAVAVLNAPSPAATAAFAIARHIVDGRG